MRNQSLRTLGILGLLCLAACGADTADDQDANPDEVVSISSGIYGQMVSYSDAPGAGGSAKRVRDHDVFIYADDAKLSAGAPAPAPLRSTKTTKGGFYEVELAPGPYQVCASSKNGAALLTGPCARFEVKAASRVRADYCLCMRSSWNVDGVRAQSSSTTD